MKRSQTDAAGFVHGFKWNSGLPSATCALRRRRGTAFLLRSLLLLIVCSSACFGQRNVEPRPAPLDRVQAEKEARALVAELLAQEPDQNTTNTGWVKIRDAAGNEQEIPAQFDIFRTPTNWVSVYETLPTPGRPGGERLTVIHADERPNRYRTERPGASRRH